jgi:hypothetical protein
VTDVSEWFTFAVSVERLTGAGAYGPVLATATSEAAMVDPGNKLTRSGTGEQVVTSARVFLASTTTAIPDGSRVTLPATFGSRASTVITSLLHTSGLGTPDHLELVLE